MVRVISEKLFSPPRSRHSSGEAVDKELAARAVEALSGFNSRRFELSSDYESSSDSHWDSEVDFEGDGLETGIPEDGAAGEEEIQGGTDVIQKRRERRRERNKLSAQAYRIRRREQSAKQQSVLRELQEKNSHLKTEVHSLETQIDSLRQSAVGHCLLPIPGTVTAPPLSPVPIFTTGAAATPATALLQHPPQLSSSGGPLLAFRELGEDQDDALPPDHPHHHHHHHHHHQGVDNHLSHRRLVSPVVDNLFSRPSPDTSIDPSPSLTSSSLSQSSHPSLTLSSSCAVPRSLFSNNDNGNNVPPPPLPPCAAPAPIVASASASALAPTTTTTTSTATTATVGSPSAAVAAAVACPSLFHSSPAHPLALHQQQKAQLTNLNANIGGGTSLYHRHDHHQDTSNSSGSGTSVNANAVTGLCLNNNANNNNNNSSSNNNNSNNSNMLGNTGAMGGARPKTRAAPLTPQVFRFVQAGTRPELT